MSISKKGIRRVINRIPFLKLQPLIFIFQFTKRQLFAKGTFNSIAFTFVPQSHPHPLAPIPSSLVE